MPSLLRALRTAAASPSLRLLRHRYRREVRRPLAALLFLLPLVVFYEVAVRRMPGGGGEILAHTLIQRTLSWFGLAGPWTPAVLLVGVLLLWHLRRKDRWELHGATLGIMAFQGLLLAVPLLVLAALFQMPSGTAGAALRPRVVVELGAGIYEEFVFRLLLISGLAWLLAQIARLPRQWAQGVAVGLAALAFALCHFGPIGRDPFEWRSFWFRLAAGVYLSVVFLGRGLGVAGGCHAGYNIALVLIRG